MTSHTKARKELPPIRNYRGQFRIVIKVRSASCTLTIKSQYPSSQHHSHLLKKLAQDYQKNGNNTLSLRFQSPKFILGLLGSQGDNQERVKLPHLTSFHYWKVVRVLQIDFKLAILVTSEFLHTIIQSKKNWNFLSQQAYQEIYFTLKLPVQIQ